VLCAAVPPPALHAALAAAAGTLFEAAPFVLAASLLPTGGLRALAYASGCGCRASPLPGALAVPPAALAALAFGWPIAIARAGAAAVVARAVARADRADRAGARPSHADRDPSPIATLGGLVVPAIGVALIRELAAPLALGGAHDAWFAWPARFVVGLLAGALMPCATAGIAVAIGLRAATETHGASGTVGTLGALATLVVHSPLACGILATCGIVPARSSDRASRRGVDAVAVDADARPALVALSLLLGAAAIGGTPGLVSPRLAPVLALGACAAIAALRRSARVPRAMAVLVPAVMFAALVDRTPTPIGVADATALENAVAGERLTFVGIAHRAGPVTVLERSTITCCRIDANTSAVALTRALHVADGTWIAADGTLVRATDGRLRLAPQRARVVVAPRDPFAYR